MKNIHTLLLLLLFAFIGHGQEATTVYFGMYGKDIYYKTDANIYMGAVGITFENEVSSTIASDNITSWSNIYGYRNGVGLQPNSTALYLSVTTNPSDPKKILLYGSAKDVLKPTNGEFVKFFTLTNDNTIAQVYEIGLFRSDDITITSDEAVRSEDVTIVVDNTLKLDDITDVKIAPYPNPITGDFLHISGLTQTMQATIYDLTGKVVSSSQVTPSNNTLDVSILTSSLYVLNIAKGGSSKGFTILKK
ncbi:MAG: T9SS type A sorting domain-containing protein [Bacteroidetes bacterium]|nr:T9SS type A sorting domain-containing protein [Bacteroidota bacterium]